jgi:hypothetical protein
MDNSACNVIDMAIAMQCIQHQEEPRLLIVMFLDPGRKIRLNRKAVLRPPS